jgi:hypothetical protein
MNRAIALLLTALVLSGCKSAASPSIDRVLANDRLKRDEVPSKSPMFIFPDGSFNADGIWIPVPDDEAHRPVFPEQTHIECDRGAFDCREMKVSFTSVAGLVSVDGPDNTLWPIKSWDKNSLLAEYGPFPSFEPGPDRCQKHVLSIVFASGTVTTSDIPTNGDGCDAFKEAHSYRLASGYYVVDTSPGNNSFRDTSTR